ncbi:Hypothetical predicted protein [Octopus vulgaris]|uniref:Uncharacterized protein n=1 Tax=Octopus vulgaris TaxID=6645 RepID=A0AA36BQV5_OCTVU|nr:Hypothetical predicted protein [Octopus vulgaris]
MICYGCQAEYLCTSYYQFYTCDIPKLFRRFNIVFFVARHVRGTNYKVTNSSLETKTRIERQKTHWISKRQRVTWSRRDYGNNGGGIGCDGCGANCDDDNMHITEVVPDLRLAIH